MARLGKNREFFSFYHLFLFDYLELIFFHRYRARSFDTKKAKQNLIELMKLKADEELKADRFGRLSRVRKKWQKGGLFFLNLLFLGALKVRLKRAILFTFMAASAEFLNPYDHRRVQLFLKKKEGLFRRMQRKIALLGLELRQVEEIWQLFLRSSLIQDRVIRRVKSAVYHQKKPPLVVEVEQGLESGLMPLLIREGKSGAYAMRGTDRQILGIFKPFDEEFFALNNPVGHGGRAPLGVRAVRSGIRLGEAAHHEVAAFLVDAFFGFGIVPKTYYARFTHEAFFSAREGRLERMKKKEKFGSFQCYVEGFVSFALLDPSTRNALSLDDYQTLLFFDLIVGNSDRHLNNLLIGEGEIAAIDHAYCFPDRAAQLSFSLWNILPWGNELFHPQIIKLAQEFPLEEMSWKLRKHALFSIDKLARMRERVALFAVAAERFPPNQLQAILSLENLHELVDLDATLKGRCEQLVSDHL